jgi:hypothetical protein
MARPKSQETLQKENDALKNKLAKMEEMLNSLMSENTKPKQKKVEIVEEFEDDSIPEIPLNKTVRVMSLFHGGLNLKTEQNGSQVFRFEMVGQILPIIYSDLVKILANQRKFFENGYCMILDKDVVKAHYLEDYCKKFIDAKTINNILDYESDKIEQIFSGVTSVIQQTIVDIIISKINKNDYVDKNKISAINKVYGKDIFELAYKLR